MVGETVRAKLVNLFDGSADKENKEPYHPKFTYQSTRFVSGGSSVDADRDWFLRGEDRSQSPPLAIYTDDDVVRKALGTSTLDQDTKSTPMTMSSVAHHRSRTSSSSCPPRGSRSAHRPLNPSCLLHKLGTVSISPHSNRPDFRREHSTLKIFDHHLPLPGTSPLEKQATRVTMKRFPRLPRTRQIWTISPSPTRASMCLIPLPVQAIALTKLATREDSRLAPPWPMCLAISAKHQELQTQPA
ncbi:hypothetical protein B0T11DRAFT_5901 [Plectosphaerella cucumerina]|uniref:Uncharacterized protein n=1 Tax=Plectosphaerella cucumerina TaxID=40658 RepID=A0A8K0X8Z5_9PEZI|nr:hypothetical protein B0T11DRAFT_5901 [Plectosphaerella cucumerina]